MSLAEAQTYRWTLNRYLDMAESGVLADEKVELINGEIVAMPAQKEPHALAVSRATRELMAIFPEPYFVKIQSTFRLSDLSAPEPDIMVLPEVKDAGRALHDTPLLIVEVSETTLRYDRGAKANMYAARGVQDYWIIDVVHDQVEVYRNPARDVQAPFGWKYAPAVVRTRGERVDLLAAPGKTIEVTRLLP
jgi:Uma2 family endonuclease